MKSVRLFTALIFIATGLVGCAPSEEEAARMLKHYRADAAARNAKLIECRETAGFVRKEWDCLIAREALQLEPGRALRDMPPMGLLNDDEDGKRSQD